MGRGLRTWAAVAIALALTGAAPSMKDILAHSPRADWHVINPPYTLVMSLTHGAGTIQLAPAFAPNTVSNILRLGHARYFDGSFVVRAQDNYVVQWARSDKRSISSGAMKTIPLEFDHAATVEFPFHPLPDPDTYAPETGFSFDFPSARDVASKRIWLVHCYGMVGVGR